jgi:hypothetical protein
VGSLFIYVDGTWRDILSNNTGWSLNGNAGTFPSTSFLGTTDSVWSQGSTNYPGFKMKVNNRKSALIEIVNKNVAFGYRAMELTTTGYWNTAFGYQALQRNLTTGYNTAVGFRAMQWGYGPYVTCIGHATECYSLSVWNCSALCDGATVNDTSKIRIGDATMECIEGQVPWSTPSDGRFKFNVSENVPGLDFIKLLRPVTYNFDTRAYTEWLIRFMPPEMQEERLVKDFGPSTALLHTGFIAQDVEEAVTSLGFDFDGLEIPKGEAGNYSIAYSQFVVPLVKAVQEQQAMIDDLKKQNEALLKRMEMLETVR